MEIDARVEAWASLQLLPGVSAQVLAGLLKALGGPEEVQGASRANLAKLVPTELASAIEAAPRDWRWWIRRHPSSRHHQDTEFGRLLGLRGENVLVEGLDVELEPELPVVLEVVAALAARAPPAIRPEVSAPMASDWALSKIGVQVAPPSSER